MNRFETLQPRALREAGDWVHALADWTHMAHWTFEHNVARDHAVHAVEEWARDMARNVVRDHLRIAWGVERGDLGGRTHLHGLIAAPRSFPPLLDDAVAFRRWRTLYPTNGFLSLRAYRRNRGGAWYLTKGGDWGIYTACSRLGRCKHRRCAIASSERR